jgi:hypothetical protein
LFAIDWLIVTATSSGPLDARKTTCALQSRNINAPGNVNSAKEVGSTLRIGRSLRRCLSVQHVTHPFAASANGIAGRYKAASNLMKQVAVVRQSQM